MRYTSPSLSNDLYQSPRLSDYYSYYKVINENADTQFGTRFSYSSVFVFLPISERFLHHLGPERNKGSFGQT